MSYLVIARKWRPQAFDEVTGQEPITLTLRNAIENDRLHHAYLFSGARGVGKTTTARLLAKALNCHKTSGPNVKPCRTDDGDQCPSCREVAESRSMDVLEIDAASHTGVGDVRGVILENINITPARDRFKVFIIDEIHQLSKPAFNALLKTLEEPPPNVVFIMATTELHKVPETILSRCQQFEFRTISSQKIFERLRFIADAEKVAASDAALREIARSGEGSMRDAQSNFDQVISFADGSIDVADVARALGMASADMLTGVVAAIAEDDRRRIFEIVGNLVARGYDLRNYARDLLALFRDLLVYKVDPSAELIEGSALTADEINAAAERFSEADLLRFFNSLADTEASLKTSTQSRYTLEIGLIKLIEMRSVSSVEKLLERLAALEKQLTADTSPATGQAAAAGEKKTLISDADPQKAAFSEDSPQSSSDHDHIPIEPERPCLAAIAPAILKSVAVRLPALDAADLEHVDDTWLDAAFEMKLVRSGDNLGAIVGASRLVSDFTLAPRQSAGPLPNGSTSAAAAAIAAEFIKRVPEPEPIDDAVPERPDGDAPEQLLEFAKNHPTVKRAMRIFRGKITDVRCA